MAESAMIQSNMTQPARHFLQTDAWGAFQEALGRKVVQQSGDGWHFLAIIERGRLGTRLYCPYGPTANGEDSLKVAIDELKKLAQRHKAMFVRMEPMAPVSAEILRSLGAVPAPRDIQPKHTWRVDLTQPEADIIAKMRATNRNLHRTAGKKGISFRASNDPQDIFAFLEFIHETARRTGIKPHSDSYFETQARTLMPLGAAKLFFADFEDTPIAAAFAYDSVDGRFYAHAGSSFAHRKLHAGEPLVTHMMLDAKQKGLQFFDFFGIAPPDEENHAWAGFTKFKKSFGGGQVDFLGAWDVPVQPRRYSFYRRTLAAVGRVYAQ